MTVYPGPGQDPSDDNDDEEDTVPDTDTVSGLDVARRILSEAPATATVTVLSTGHVSLILTQATETYDRVDAFNHLLDVIGGQRVNLVDPPWKCATGTYDGHDIWIYCPLTLAEVTAMAASTAADIEAWTFNPVHAAAFAPDPYEPKILHQGVREDQP